MYDPKPQAVTYGAVFLALMLWMKRLSLCRMLNPKQ